MISQTESGNDIFSIPGVTVIQASLVFMELSSEITSAPDLMVILLLRWYTECTRMPWHQRHRTHTMTISHHPTRLNTFMRNLTQFYCFIISAVLTVAWCHYDIKLTTNMFTFWSAIISMCKFGWCETVDDRLTIETSFRVDTSN